MLEAGQDPAAQAPNTEGCYYSFPDEDCLETCSSGTSVGKPKICHRATVVIYPVINGRPKVLGFNELLLHLRRKVPIQGRNRTFPAKYLSLPGITLYFSDINFFF